MKQTIIFSGTCAANSELTLVSKRIEFPFNLIKFVPSFALGTNKTLQLKLYISKDKVAPTTGTPSGINILGLFGEDPYVIGDDEQKSLDLMIEYKDSGYYIKVYANNTDNFGHTVDTFVIIESLED